MTCWAILTGEYPPAWGGVSDYTRLVALGLAAAGDEVHVFAPGQPLPEGTVRCHALPDHYGPRSLTQLDHTLARLRPDLLLLQYTPHAFGYKAMNLPLAVWLARRAARLAPLWVMFHEVAFPFSWRSMKYAVLATVHRLMARLITEAAERIFVSIPAWSRLLQRFCPSSRPIEWLPVPSTLPVVANGEAVTALRRSLTADGKLLVGHFSTYGHGIAPLLKATIHHIASKLPAVCFLLLGRNSTTFATYLKGNDPILDGKVVACGEAAGEAISAHLRVCDLLLQPYPDGVSSRRTTVMAGLALGLPIVTNLGPLSEPLWAEERAVAAVASAEPQVLAERVITLLNDAAGRAELASRAAALYQRRFRFERTIAALRRRPCIAPTGC